MWRAYALGGRWSLGANIYYAAFPVYSSVPNYSLSFLGSNIRLGYALFDTARWKLTLNLGGYFTTSFTTGTQFGYYNLIYPSFTPVLNYNRANGDSISIYVKFASLASSFSLSTAQMELAGGLSYSIRKSANHAIILSLDGSALSYQPSSLVNINLTSVSLSAGYRL